MCRSSARPVDPGNDSRRLYSLRLDVFLCGLICFFGFCFFRDFSLCVKQSGVERRMNGCILGGRGDLTGRG